MTENRPRRARRNPIWQAVIITEILVGSLVGGVLVAVLLW